ncbi:MAG: TonB-dependent receptor, partial [Bacteroidales bacterium]|nr:TonB-dependent receptor [Bacteroidales bacterium]
HRRKSTELSMFDPIKYEKMGEKELLKAACCNLSESFETNPSVDVSFTDAVTGTRQIQLLGLAGPYTQITRENMPDVRGLSSVYGLTYTPGPWIESIQLNKGTGSVANGYESIAGQINVELRKPEDADRLYLNLFANESGRTEVNANLAHRFKNEKWSTGLLLHGKDNSFQHDNNNDSFLDHPLGNTFIGVNRWKYVGDNGMRVQLGVKLTSIDKEAGQYDELGVSTGYPTWKMNLEINQVEGWSKIGKVYADKPWKSQGLQLSGSFHQQESRFGNNEYNASQSSIYVNYLYQGIISNTKHKFRTGISFKYDDYKEELNHSSYDRMELVPGIYGEYTYTHLEKFATVAGLRFDHHNHYGLFVTPRLHLRYAIVEKSVLRASVGYGYRTANVLAENNSLLASSRQIIIEGDDSNKPYGLNIEQAWNYGINFTQKFILDYRGGSISFDLYRTNFVNQIVVDLDQNPQQAVFYNLNGRSYSNSFQSQFDYEVINRLDVRLAYRWYDIKTTYAGDLQQKPLIASHRAFANFAYQSRKHWKFDYTLNWQGRKRIPNTSANPVQYQLDEYSPSFIVMNAQVSKSWREVFEVYLGVENLLNYKQKDPIIASGEPYSEYFDATMIWGPVFGRKIYGGLRYMLK